MTTTPVKIGASSPPPIKLLDQVRDRIRYKHYGLRTEHSYVQWVKRFALFHVKWNPNTMEVLRQFSTNGYQVQFVPDQ